MRKYFAMAFAVGLISILPVSLSALPDPGLTTADLLSEMVTLGRLARPFPDGTRMIQFSSYDRASHIVNGDTVNWWANADFGRYLRKETTPHGTEYVMAEANGPGAIVRLWSANPGRRIWRVYLDGASEPVLEARGNDLLEGKVKPWGKAFSERRNMGANFIFPIPFAKSVKVTVQGGAKAPLMYYHVDLRLYPAGVAVRAFSPAELTALAERMTATANILLDPDSLDAKIAGDCQAAEVTLAPGAEGELFTLDQPGAIALLQLEVQAGPEDLAAVLAQTLLMIRWDEEQKAAVMTPLGDFFGTSPGANEMESLPLSVHPTADGARLTCRWVMPFQRSARLTLINGSPKRLNLRASVVTVPWSWEQSFYFHAGWRESNTVATRPFHDLRLLAVQGRGNFVGLELNVRNPMEYFWWGEGDERVWVDDDQFPSIFGTGTEDYFGYAWCVQYFKFTAAYHGVSLPTREWLFVPQAAALPFFWEWLSKASSRQAVVSQYRFQILDAIPFDQKLRFDMEISHHRNTTVDVNAAAFWYAAPGSQDDATLPALSNRQVWSAK